MDKTYQKNESIVISVDRELTATNVQDFRNELHHVLRSSPEEVIVDLSETVMLDSLGMGAFITAYNFLKQTGGELKIVNASEDIYTLLKTVRFDKYFVVEKK